MCIVYCLQIEMGNWFLRHAFSTFWVKAHVEAQLRKCWQSKVEGSFLSRCDGKGPFSPMNFYRQ